jgi:pSer/pThr/pTyr-binding forkhead associated (FHA) protein
MRVTARRHAQQPVCSYQNRTLAVAHITFANKQNSKPLLQFYSEERGEVRRVTVEQSPFRIGRCEKADLRIDSAQVSREHAEVYERGGHWFIRDLGSTNGTEVNGESATDAQLRDGDVIRFVDIELIFLNTSATPFQRMATQPAVRAVQPRPQVGLPDELMAARRLVELALSQSQHVGLSHIRSLRTQQTEALVARQTAFYTADEPDGQLPQHPALTLCDDLYRRRAVELALESRCSQRLFISMGCQGTCQPQQLASALESLYALTPVGWKLGVSLPMSVAFERWKLDELGRLVRESDTLVALEDFQGTAAQVAMLEACPVEYMLLSPSMCEGVDTSRQPIRRLESVYAACEELDIRPVLPAACSGPLAEVCGDLGFDLVVSLAASDPAPRGRSLDAPQLTTV